MDELIYRSEAIKAMLKQEMLTPSVIRRVLMQVPTVNAVVIAEENNGQAVRCARQRQDGTLVEFLPVVRCKDCRYFEIDPDDFLGLCKCGNIATNQAGEIYPEREHFCSYGERRSNGEGERM